MKKISLIACATLVAGLLVSCSSEAGVKDYNNVRSTSAVNNYIVSGSITTVVEESKTTYDDEGKQRGYYKNYYSEWDDTLGTVVLHEEDVLDYSKKTTTTTEAKAIAGVVSYGVDSEFDSNYQKYTIKTDAASKAGYKSIKYDEDKIWSTAKKEMIDNPSKPKDVAKSSGDPDTDIGGLNFNIYAVDGTFYYESNGQRWPFEADEDAIANGESFSINVTFTTSDTSNSYDAFDKDDKKTKNNDYSNYHYSQSGKTTVTYNLTFTAK